MKTDYKLKEMVLTIRNIRAYNDYRSILIKLEIINELNLQIKNTLFLINTPRNDYYELENNEEEVQ